MVTLLLNKMIDLCLTQENDKTFKVYICFKNHPVSPKKWTNQHWINGCLCIYLHWINFFSYLSSMGTDRRTDRRTQDGWTDRRVKELLAFCSNSFSVIDQRTEGPTDRQIKLLMKMY